MRVHLLILLVMALRVFGATRLEYRTYVQYPPGVGETLIHQMFPDSIGLDWHALVTQALATDSLKKNHAFWRQLKNVIQDQSPSESAIYIISSSHLRYDLPTDSVSYLMNLHSRDVDILNHASHQVLRIEDIELDGPREDGAVHIRLLDSGDKDMHGAFACAVKYLTFDRDTVARILDDLSSPYQSESKKIVEVMQSTPILGVFPDDYLHAMESLHFPVRTEFLIGDMKLVTELVDVRDIPDGALFDVPDSYTSASEADILPYLESLQKGPR